MRVMKKTTKDNMDPTIIKNNPNYKMEIQRRIN